MIVKLHFKDENHDCDVECYPDSEYSWEYYCNIDGIKFETDYLFFSLGLADNSDVGRAAEKFCLQKIGGTRTACGVTVTNPYHYCLQRYSLEVEIPIKVISKENNRDLPALIKYKIVKTAHNEEKNKYPDFAFLENEKVIFDDTDLEYFTLIVGSEEYSTHDFFGDDTFEAAMLNICRKIKDKYYLKCCFGCAYSDYNPYGGLGMECWRNAGDFYKFPKAKGNFDHNMCSQSEFTLDLDVCDDFMVRNGDYGCRRGIYNK